MFELVRVKTYTILLCVRSLLLTEPPAARKAVSPTKVEVADGVGVVELEPELAVALS